ncbi:maleylpyruvate isomerase N-terminal domain-containing protein [Mycolicibacterium sp. BiH015]|uniref:maleylpyruvate isomerase family mycothiol-dependent enzyme n=1 Tax=Mycolicibacterium sp. BiH015 TaxID=3018808 RepID=UPI0022E58DD1|nr:maleylpyruvate isomerase N-terminal domain-containing protein [Mycolicibacterium sp. BiH015]MDA2889393.1 maleylpyruvate isomerase N-terminal domain-containing protein [Mycolicibacterium sp. BiH015]
MTASRTVFLSAAQSLADLVRRIPATAWEKPGLGAWTVRDLVGHTSRSLITVSTYLKAPAQRETVTTAADYYAAIRELSAGMGEDAIVERGRQAGRDLGTDPASAVDALVAQVTTDLDAVEDPLIEVIGGIGMRLSTYLPTRTFEMAVHGLDIAHAVGIDYAPPADVLADATALAARIAVALGQGTPVLLALTGRQRLSPGFSVV